jgi:hypothetical protein
MQGAMERRVEAIISHTAHMRVDKKDGSAERFWNFYDIYTQQWTRTTNHKSDES